MISVGNRRIGELSVTNGGNPVGRNVSTRVETEYWKAQRNRGESVIYAGRFPQVIRLRRRWSYQRGFHVARRAPVTTV